MSFINTLKIIHLQKDFQGVVTGHGWSYPKTFSKSPC